MAYKRSVFPSSIDSIQEIIDLPPSQKANALRYKTLKTQAILTSEEVIELNLLITQLQNYLITPETFNKFSDICINLETFFLSNTQTYVDNLQTETQSYVDLKQAEFDAEINKFTLIGQYDSATQYYSKNIVAYAGNLYLCIINSFGNIPVGDINDLYFTILSRKGDRGEVGLNLNYRGDYNALTNYIVGDAVTYNSLLYYCKAPTLNNIPTVINYWVLFDKITIGNNPPASPVSNQIWIDTANNLIKHWDGASWISSNALAVTDGTLTYTPTNIKSISDKVNILSGISGNVEKTNLSTYTAHNEDTTKHVTLVEKNYWNTKLDGSKYNRLHAEWDAQDLTLISGLLTNDNLCWLSKNVQYIQSTPPILVTIAKATYSLLRYGKYSVGFRIKSTNIISTSALTTLKVLNADAGVVASLAVKGTDFISGTAYQMFYLPFENIGQSTGNAFTFALTSEAVASFTMSIDSIIVEPIHAVNFAG